MARIGPPRHAAETKSGVGRRDFLRLAAAAGLLGATSAGCLARLRGSVRAPAADPSPVGPEYLARGLVAMSDAHRRGWVAGHYGAAVLAAHFFCKDNRLEERTGRAIRANVDAFIERRPAEFPSPDPGPGTADVAAIVEQLDGQVSELRSGGHDAIFGSLALRALDDRPDLATPAVVDGIRRLLRAHAEDRPPVAETTHNLEHALPPYGSAADVAAITLRATLCPWSHVRHVGASGVLHWVTHAEGLVTLEELGHADLARRGHAALRLHVNGRPVVDDGTAGPGRAPMDWLGAEYWERDAPRRALGGTWLFGHSFKLPYSLFRLLRRVDDATLRSASLVRAAELLVPFE